MFNYDVVLDYGAEAVDDFLGDSLIMRWYWRKINFYTGVHRKYNGTFFYRNGCRIIILDRYSRNPRRTLLHEIGHHISIGYLIDRDDKVLEKHADFWAGAIAYRISKKEQGWTAHDLGLGVPNFGREYPYDFDRARAFKLGWAQAEYGDSIWAYYGTYYEKHHDWLYEPSHIVLYSRADDDGWIVLNRKKTVIGD